MHMRLLLEMQNYLILNWYGSNENNNDADY